MTINLPDDPEVSLPSLLPPHHACPPLPSLLPHRVHCSRAPYQAPPSTGSLQLCCLPPWVPRPPHPLLQDRIGEKVREGVKKYFAYDEEAAYA